MTTAGLPTPVDRAAYQRLMHTLMGAHLDFHVVDTDLLVSGHLTSGQVAVQDVAVRVVLVPPLQYIEPELAAWLQSFAQNGGQVVYCPADFQETNLLNEIGRTISPSLNLLSAGVENSALWSVQRLRGDRMVWLVLNISSTSQIVELATGAGVHLVELPLDAETGPRLERRESFYEDLCSL